jgi:PAS domain S-box-containing protein
MSAATSPNFSQYRTVGEAAAFLGISTATLRNWDRSGKLTPRRHPQNGYRIYLHEDLEAVLRSADISNLTDGSFAPQVDWEEMGEREHFVQFYESDDYLIDSVSGFVAATLQKQEASVVIATAKHREALQRKLSACGVEIEDSVAAGRFIVLDAEETLSKFIVAGSPDPQRFKDTVGAVIARLTQAGRKIHAFGEMVALLWADGNREAAIRLEELWNDLGKEHHFALFCAYPMSGFDGESLADPLSSVCSCHSRVIPAESYSALGELDPRLRAVTLLQQKAQSLEAEIAHRVEVQKVLSDQERELKDFFENATEGIHKVGPDGTILWANKAEHDLLGYTLAEYVGHSIKEFHADAPVIEDILARLRRGETLENYSARLRCKNGQIKHVLINSSACFENGEFAYTRCFTRDITERWEAEQALHDADRRKDEFLATLAHELRNPLAPIRNSLEVLKADGHNQETAAQVRNIMDRQVRHLTRLVDDLLDISRVTRDKIELRKERVDLASIIKTAVETSRPLMDSAGHDLIVTLPGQPIILEADPTRLAQVFANLLNNSAKYTESGGRIEIEARQQGSEVTICIRDNGVGIACDALAYVFDMFRQVDRSLERSQGGLGIGLTLARRLVELHGGKINALSDGPGQGSEFIVRLPVAPALSARHGEPRGAAINVPSRRILVVDDNKDSADTLGTLLRIKGHQIRTAGDGLRAIEVAAEFRPEVILMDVGMPRMNGYDATSRIRQTPWGKEVFIIALTGWGQESDVQNSVDAGCSAHLVKPVDLAALEGLLVSAKNLAR